MYLLYLILGIVALWLGTEMVIKGALKITDYYNLSQMFVGVTILSIGTDLPEMVISTDAAIEKLQTGIDTSGLIVGNAVGSAFSQITIVLGIAGLTGYLALKRKHLFADGFMVLASIILFFILGFDGEISRKEGGIMVLVYLIYYVRMFQQENVKEKVSEKKPSKNMLMAIIILVGGLFIVVFSSDIVVHNALKFAEVMNIRQSFVGILIIGLGTSLPELAVSIGAARKKATYLSIGNLIGSNIFDVLMPIGLGGLISELKFSTDLIFIDIPALLIVTVVALIFFYRTDGLQKKEAIAMILLFLIYAVLKFVGL